jgi:serine/threonine-protein kinase HipA
MKGAAAYTPTDQLYLWFLTQPARPVLVGELNLVRNPRGVSLTYDASWVERGFALSEDLPLLAQEFFPLEKDRAAGAVDDARPDRWGERVIRFIDRPPRLALLDFLYFAGHERFGALGVSTSRATYAPRTLGPLPVLDDVPRLEELVQRVLHGEPVAERDRRLIAPGVTMGGAKPKALLELDRRQWVVKFADGDAVDTPLVEHASMTLAKEAGIRVANTRPIRLPGGHAIAIERFDRVGDLRLHALSADVALRAASEELGYPELAQLLRRRGPSDEAAAVAQMRELFRRMVFNILIDNTDDHEKNHALLVNDAQQYELSLAFDVLPSGQALGYQQLRVGRAGAESTLDNALSESGLFSLTRDQAVSEIRRVVAVVSGWRRHFQSQGVSRADLELLTEQIDRPFLRAQRSEAVFTRAAQARPVNGRRRGSES